MEKTASKMPFYCLLLVLATVLALTIADGVPAKVIIRSPSPMLTIEGYPTYQAIDGENINVTAEFYNADPIPPGKEEINQLRFLAAEEESVSQELHLCRSDPCSFTYLITDANEYFDSKYTARAIDISGEIVVDKEFYIRVKEERALSKGYLHTDVREDNLSVTADVDGYPLPTQYEIRNSSGSVLYTYIPTTDTANFIVTRDVIGTSYPLYLVAISRTGKQLTMEMEDYFATTSTPTSTIGGLPGASAVKQGGLPIGAIIGCVIGGIVVLMVIIPVALKHPKCFTSAMKGCRENSGCDKRVGAGEVARRTHASQQDIEKAKPHERASLTEDVDKKWSEAPSDPAAILAPSSNPVPPVTEQTHHVQTAAPAPANPVQVQPIQIQINNFIPRAGGSMDESLTAIHAPTPSNPRTQPESLDTDTLSNSSVEADAAEPEHQIEELKERHYSNDSNDSTDLETDGARRGNTRPTRPTQVSGGSTESLTKAHTQPHED